MRHLGRAARDLLRDRLRRRDDQELRLRQQLRERHRHVAGARRQVDEQEVELAPVDVLEELRERLVEHRPAPDDGGVLLDEEADRHDLHAVVLERQDLAVGRDLRAPADVEHARDRVAPDVGVEDADLLALGRERRRQVGGDASTCRRRPCPEPTQTTLETCASAPSGSAPRPSFCCRPAFSWSERTSKATLTRVTPWRPPTAVRTAFSKWLRIGQPGVVSETVTSTVPSARASIDRTISSSTMERRSSGSMTALSAWRISSRVGMRSILANGSRCPGRAGRTRERAARGRPALWGGEVLLCRRDM